MDDFEKKQTKKMKTFDSFTSPSEAIEKLTMIVVALVRGETISAQGKLYEQDCKEKLPRLTSNDLLSVTFPSDRSEKQSKNYEKYISIL